MFCHIRRIRIGWGTDSKLYLKHNIFFSSECAENAKAVYALVIPPTLALNPKPVNTSLCAVASHKLVVGGEKAESKEFPHMAAIGFDSSNGILWLCGGSLISSKIVLTAAHCIWTADW